MILKKYSTILFVFCFGYSFSQNEQKLYFDTYFEGLSYLNSDSASFNLSKADSILQPLFLNVRNQIEDIDYVIGRLKKLNFPVPESYYRSQVKESKNYLNYKLQTNSLYRIKRPTYRKWKKTLANPKRIKKKQTFKLLRMLHKDQRARKKNNALKMNAIDSLNAIEVKKMLYDSTYIKELNYLNRNIIEILIMHGGWDNYQDVIDLVHYYVDQRYLNRNFFADIFERKSLGTGTLFKITDGKLNICSNCSEKLCSKSPMYPSNTGDRQYYINGLHVFVPVNPNLSTEELNLFRRYCFLPNYTSGSKNKTIIFPTISEWCTLNNYL